ncbi:hypothetical protein Dsin_022388 [Dipteronia sinensis]|uniref:NB-ARC domain-containing protein n=1 Tax=Dipteronia sinensis TaxID=43782 RepID=A0AAE0A1B5_9ROSI|nr:hypothetical protein Dsin_022388 [Dipteronia sinensis]
MEFASNILGSILSKAGEYLVVPIAQEVGYIFCFKSIVEEFQKQDTNLRLAQEHVQRQVDTATRNTEEIVTDVQNWLTDVRRLEDEIKANESRLNGWCPHWGCRYKSSRRVAKKTSIMLQLRDDASKLNNISHPTKFAFDGMIEALKDDERKIIGLYGMGGVGKTTLAKVVGNTTKEHKMFNEVVMVVVSQTLNVMNIQDQIADSLSMKLEEKSEQGRAKRLCLRLKGENKILLILDDVWTKLDLTAIGIAFGDDHMGCKILITTSVKQSVGNHSPTLDGIAKEVVDECNGLPLAIVTVGSLRREKDVDEWKVVCQKLRNSKLDDIENVDVDVYACLKLSYDYLKGDEILLCSLFPEDHKIELEELVRYGLGLGLYQDADSIEEARIQLRVTINTLKAYCLLLDDGEGRFVKMHDVVRDVALWITSKGDNVFMVKTGRSLREWPKLEGLETCTAISLIDNNIQVLSNGLICPKLEILLLCSGYNYPTNIKVSDGFFKE